MVVDYRFSGMSPERWRRIQDIYDSVINVPAAARESRLDELCRHDQDLRHEIESLLQARDEAGSFLSPEDLQSHIHDLLEPELAAGSTFGRYRTISAIGAGGMGRVYLAQDEELNRRVALKLLPAQFTLDRERVLRFRREARAASALTHPNIITVYDVGQNGHTWFVATEFVEGETLRSFIQREGIDVERALEIALQCARGLSAAHDAGIVHRDINRRISSCGRTGSRRSLISD